MRTLFRDPELQAQFAREGYLRHAILTPEQVVELRAAYQGLGLDTPSGFSNTITVHNPTLKARVREIVLPYLEPVIDRLFIDCRALLYSFLTKGQSDSNQFGFHQDWSFVDEAAGHVSINLWCPLVATSHQNGNLMVVPRTHELPRLPRSAPLSDNPYSRWRTDYERMALAVPTSPGEAILFDSALFHGSTANVTDEIRLITAALVVPGEATPVLFYDTAPGEVAMCEADDDFYLAHNPERTQSTHELGRRSVPVTDPRAALSSVLGTSLPEVPLHAPPATGPAKTSVKSTTVWQRVRHWIGK